MAKIVRCPNSARTVESVLSGIPGVVSVSAGRHTESTIVVRDPARVNTATLIEAINEETYYGASVRAAPPVANADAGSGVAPALLAGVLVLGMGSSAVAAA